MRASNLAFSIACGPFICAYVCFAACFCPTRLHRRAPSEEKTKFERRQKLKPRPLLVRTPERSLTIPVQRPKEVELSDPGYIRGGKTLPQLQSPLLRLPLELRQMIYRAVLGDDTFHIIFKKQKLGHIRCKAPSERYCRYMGHEECLGTMDVAKIYEPPHGQSELTGGDIIPFLQSCRQVYSESIEYLYSTNKFAFTDLDVVRHLSSTVMAHRFALITHMTVTWTMRWPIFDVFAQHLLTQTALFPPNDEATWEDTWRIVAEMPNLKELYVDLSHFDNFGEDLVLEKKLFAPLYKVKTPKKYEVVVSWSTGKDMTDAPFDFRRASTSGALEW